MQSYVDQKRSVRDLPQKFLASPINARRASLLPYIVPRRNFDFPKEIFHNPNDSVKEYNSGNVLQQVENIPATYTRNDNDDKGRGSGMWRMVTTSEVISGVEPMDNPQNYFITNTDVYRSKTPSQIIRKLSIEESNAANYLREKEKGSNLIKEKIYPIPPIPTQKLKQKFFNESHRKERQTKLLTGSVEKILQWFTLTKNFNILFEVMATLVDLRFGKYCTEKCLVLRDEKAGPCITVTFHEIDRSLPHLVLGSVVKCIGRMISKNTLQAFRVDQSSEEEKAKSQRLVFLSNLVAEEMKANMTKE